MAKIPFSSLPAEVHVSIAEHCEQNDLFNLCLVSKWMNERCVHVLYRHVDLISNRPDLDNVPQSEVDRISNAIVRQRQLVRILLSRPEYAKYVRSFKGKLRDSFAVEGRREEEMWHAMESLTQVQRVEIGSRGFDVYCFLRSSTRIPRDLFRSATSVTLIGYLEYNLAKSILNAIDPAMLTHLCLNMVQDHDIERFPPEYMPGDRSEDGRIITYGATARLLASLTGRCSALRTLILRRRGQIEDGLEWHVAAENASYVEWASFVCSVQSTLEKFTYEQAARWWKWAGLKGAESTSRIMDDKFRRLILPKIISGSWPRMTMIELQGVRSSDGGAALTTELRAVLGANVKIVIKERPLHVQECGFIVEQYED